MLVCWTCRKEMQCVKNGVGVRSKNDNVYPGDIFECVECHNSIIKTTSTSVIDENHTINTIPLIEPYGSICETCKNSDGTFNKELVMICELATRCPNK